MKRIAAFLLIFLMLVPYCVQAEESDTVNLYVSVNGSDNAQGTLNSPLRTLNGARKKVREYKGSAKNVNVNFLGGEYLIEKSTFFTREDSAENGKRITYKAYNDEEVIFTGSVRLDEQLFEPISQDDPARKRIKNEVCQKVGCMDLKKAGISDLGEYTPPASYMDTVVSLPKLYLDDDEQTLSRWPDVGYSTINSVIDGGALKKNNDYSGRPAIIGYTESAPDRWSEATDAILEGFFRYEYACERLFIDKIDTENKTITTKDSTVYGVASGKRWAVTNLLEEMDIPGEYYVDMNNMKLYFYPPYGIGGKQVELSVLTETMIVAENLENVTFSGITFKNSRARIGEFTACKGVQIKNCSAKNIAHQGFYMMDMYDTVIDGCDFENIGGYCIHIEGGDRTTLKPSNNYITNNTFYKMGRETKTYAGAVDLRGVGMYVEHNVMHEAPHQVIRFYGNEHKIRYNEIYNVVKETSDSSAIYCGKDYTMRGNEISYNYIHDISLGVDHAGIYAAAIYLDDQWSGQSIHHNLFENVNMGVLVNSGRDNIVDTNIFVNCENSIRVTNRGENAGRSYVIPGGEVYKRLMAIDYTHPPYSTKYPELAMLQYDLDNLGSPKDNTITNNLIYRSGALDIADSAVLYAKDISGNIETEEDPGFTDMENNDYSLKEDSDALIKIPQLSEIDAVSVGVTDNTERTDIEGFRLVYPKNGEKDVNYSSVYFMWDNSDRADEYEFVLAEDVGFENVVFRENVRYNHYESQELEKGKTYYWKVTAKSGSSQNRQEIASDKAFWFTTGDETSGKFLNTVALDSNIEKAGDFLTQIVEGENIGEYPSGAYKKVRDRITECKKKKREKGISQTDIDLLNSRLEVLLTEVKYSANYGWLPISDFELSDWDGNALLKSTDGILSVSNGVASCKDEYIGREMLCFDMNLQNADDKKWSGFALKQDQPDDYVYETENGKAYLVKFYGEVIELYRYKGGVSKLLASVPNEYAADGAWHSVQVGALDIKDGVRIIMYIDGNYVFDYKDKKGAIANSGHFTLYDAGGGLLIRETENLPDEQFDINKEFEYPAPVEVTEIFQNSDAWSTESSWTTGDLNFDGTVLSVNGTNFHTKDLIPADSVLKFRAKFNMGQSWQGIVLRNQNPTFKPWKTDGYLLCMKEKSIEIQKYNDEKQEYVAIFKNDYIKSGEWHDYEISMSQVSAGVRFILKIDGNTVMDYVDENPVMSAGCFGFYDISSLGIEVQGAK